ncbi:MAG: sodium:alanine symporter family protein [Clostridia bacterium]|nr:sodium:alanine symporter family protein [Clostridia bacterium]
MELINSVLCGAVMPLLLVVIGLYFAIKYKFFYVLHPLKLTKTVIKNQDGGFKSLSVALAGTLGVGNIVGVASAIQMGGAGSILWMWISAVCAMSLKYAEVFLAMNHRHFEDGNFHGGAPYYINEGLSKKLGRGFAYFLSCIFAIFCVINSLTTGNLVQINSVSGILPIKPIAFGIIFTVIAAIVIWGGIKRITKLTSVLIPVLAFTYVVLCLIIIFDEIERMPSLLKMIFEDAFNLKSATGGFCGYGIVACLRYGVSRGVLSNEAGCGTSPCAHASSTSHNSHAQGCLGVLEVFIDTIVLCSLTAFVILLTENARAKSPLSLVLSSFEIYFGKFGSSTVLILCVLFAFATVICQFYYGAEALSYITKNGVTRVIFGLIFCLVLIVGSVMPMEMMWQISDLAIALMTVLNLICLFLLRKEGADTLRKP